MNTTIINPLNLQPNEDLFIYRYLTIDKLIDFLFNQRIPLVKLNKFDDKLEGTSIEHLLLNLGSNKMSENISPFFGNTIKYVVLNINPAKRNSLRRDRDIFQRTNYASCWYANNHESVAMWQIYSHPDSVAIRINYKSLAKTLIEKKFEFNHYDQDILKFGSVHYHRLNDINELSKVIVEDDIRGFLKDYCFQHEQEFRIMLQIKDHEIKTVQRKENFLDEQIDEINQSRLLEVIYLKFSEFFSLPFEIILHPKSSSWHKENIKQLLLRNNISFPLKESILKDIYL